MPIAKVLKRDRAMIRVMLHAQRNDERSAGRAGIEDLPATDGLTFRSELVQEGEENLMAGAAFESDVVFQLRGVAFQTILIDSQTSEFRFKRLPRNPEFGSRA